MKIPKKFYPLLISKTDLNWLIEHDENLKTFIRLFWREGPGAIIKFDDVGQASEIPGVPSWFEPKLKKGFLVF